MSGSAITRRVSIKKALGNPNTVLSGFKGELCLDITTPQLYQNSDGSTGWIPIGFSIPTAPVLGPGVDGALNFDGSSVVLGITPITVGSFQVYPLTRCIYPSSIALAANTIIWESNYRIFCRGDIVGASQTTSIIHNNGNDAPLAVAGAGIANAPSTAAGIFDLALPGNNGTLGNAINNPPAPFGITYGGAAAGAGGTNTATSGVTATNPMSGGGGGGAGSITGGTGGVQGGTNSALAAGFGYDSVQQMTGRVVSAGTAFRFGSGGGQGTAIATGAGTGTNPTGGGGGGGGGCCFVGARSLSNLTISANGGRGADGAVGTVGTGTGASGGGGGGAGIAIINYGTRKNVTFSAVGGAGGIGHVSGGGCLAANGGGGGPGWVLAYNLSGDGT